MEKNARLADIYIKIYNKRTLTMDDLDFLAKYDPECFAKTCQNLVYNIPETQKLLQQEQSVPEEAKAVAEPPLKLENVNVLLENLKKMEMKELPVKEVNPEAVKDLLGSLYMEKLFPHNDRDQYFKMETEDEELMFNKKV